MSRDSLQIHIPVPQLIEDNIIPGIQIGQSFKKIIEIGVEIQPDFLDCFDVAINHEAGMRSLRCISEQTVLSP
jgi:hypothetical protein